jgi:lipopolysaccharide/colanic/teichoic acid biosynthesis glycosyltransferase
MPADVGLDEAFAPRSGLPRMAEVPIALAGLLALSPLLVVAALAVVATSPGGPFFRHVRVGRGGRLFGLYKLRSMRLETHGPDLTARGDPRVTPVGRFLRRTKIDEIPQLWNVVVGDMSLVGPRPESPRYASLEDAQWCKVLQVRPGITDPLTLALRDEQALMPEGAEERERFYLETLQPIKLQGYLDYLARRSPASDIGVLMATLVAIVRPQRAPSREDLLRRGRV